MARSNKIDRELINRMAAQRTSRRRFMGRGAVALGAVAVGPAILAACGSDSKESTSTNTTAGGADALRGTTVSMFTWVYYIENNDAESSNTLNTFQDQTGITIDYQTNIDSNEDFFTKYGPELEAGRGIGADIVVVTSWAAAQMIADGWALEFDSGSIPNQTNILPDLASPEWDSGRKYSLPYAIGQSGLAYYPAETGGPIDDVNALFDPQFAGKVTLLDEMRDTVGMTMLGMGFNPQTGTVEQAKEAIAKIGAARDDGQFKEITGNDYAEDLDNGQTTLSMAWSGDIASIRAENEAVNWVIPSQGGMRFVDTMVIPLGAKNQAGAEAFMNYLYDPAVSGPLFEAISYVSPVEGALAEMTPEAQESPFISPPASPVLYDFMTLTPDEDEELTTLFAEATQL
jgi:spermidine/putrescine transport system substrate-binding protein